MCPMTLRKHYACVENQQLDLHFDCHLRAVPVEILGRQKDKYNEWCVIAALFFF